MANYPCLLNIDRVKLESSKGGVTSQVDIQSSSVTLIHGNLTQVVQPDFILMQDAEGGRMLLDQTKLEFTGKTITRTGGLNVNGLDVTSDQDGVTLSSAGNLVLHADSGVLQFDPASWWINNYSGTEGEVVTIINNQPSWGPNLGATGPMGADSTVTGPTGDFGPTGSAGADSSVTGPMGDTGSAGADSTVPGPQGVTGPQGPTGASGLVAASWKNGGTFGNVNVTISTANIVLKTSGAITASGTNKFMIQYQFIFTGVSSGSVLSTLARGPSTPVTSDTNIANGTPMTSSLQAATGRMAWTNFTNNSSFTSSAFFVDTPAAGTWYYTIWASTAAGSGIVAYANISVIQVL
jgi:hypothetical protein